MDRRERNANGQAAMLAALAGAQATIWTALPGIIQSFDPAKRTCTVQPTIEANVQAKDGSFSWQALPLLLDCPVVFPGGGGFVLTFPLTSGDECLVVFASRCIDAWWQSGGVQVQAEMRMHSLSDGFVIAGVSSVPNVETAISTTAVQLRNAAGTARVAIDADNNVDVLTPGNLTASADGSAAVTAGVSVSFTAPTINLTGDVVVSGSMSVSGSLTNASKNVGGTHTHSGVTVGSGNTGAPV